MKNFNKRGFRKGEGGFGGRSKFGGNRKFGGGRDGSDRFGGRTELFPAVCADCGKSCEVPFRPTGDKPVYCRDCFGKSGRSNIGRNNRPSGDYRPVPAQAQNENSNIAALTEQVASLELKVNKVLELINQKAIERETKEKAPKTKVVKAKKTKIPVRKSREKRKK